MTSPAFDSALKATGYLQQDGSAAPGLVRRGEEASARLRPILADTRVGLQADAVFTAQNVPTTIFKDAGGQPPTEKEISKWHEAAWNVGVAPLLWIVTPTEVRLYDCYASPSKADPAPKPLGLFPLDAAEKMRALDGICGRWATETGVFWSSNIGKRIDRQRRVDRELLGEINALEYRLTKLPLAGQKREPESAAEIRISRDFAQRLIGRCIFTSYLVDRGIAQPFLPDNIPPHVREMFGSEKSTFALFKWLRSTFNGDLFPMNDPGAEQKQLTSDHLALMRDFIDGSSLVSGQGRLFRFRYDAIPVDLVSSIYQQFARSSAEDQAKVQGLHYTPVELVHLTLDPVFESLPANARVIDPTCGSGAFLVESFRRLVWRRSGGAPAKRKVIRDVLNKQLFGIDINRSALGIAAFSLYLAALELDEEPIHELADLKFDRLIGLTLFEGDALNALPEAIASKSFDAVVGNPPWTFVKGAAPRPPREAGVDGTARPRRSPDQEFLKVGARLAGKTGRVGMIIKASPIFSRDHHAIDSRRELLSELSPVAMVNLSALRREKLFPQAVGPALIVFARCALSATPGKLLVGSIPWTPDFRRNGVFHVGPSEVREIPLTRVLETPAMLKAATFGTVRDGWLIEKLEKSLPSLEALLEESHLGIRGQGFQVDGDKNKPPREFYSFDVVTTDSYTPFRIDQRQLPRFSHATLHRIRNPEIYEGPILLCPKGSHSNAAAPGRYSASVAFGNVLFNESFYGISFKGHDAKAARILSAILNSSLTSFQLAFAGSAWGLERPTVEPTDLLSLKVPRLGGASQAQLNAVLKAEEAAAADGYARESLAKLDQAVFDLYDLEVDECTIASESLARAQMMLSEDRKERLALIRTPRDEQMASYAREVVKTVNAYLRAAGKRHLEAVLYPRQLAGANPAAGAPGITAVRFAMAAGAPNGSQPVREGSQAEVEHLAALLRGRVNADVPPYLNVRRHLRVYAKSDLFILKPSEARYWTRTAGLNDADIILADHWISAKHASVA